jgi:hypothetical protein
MRRTQTPLHLRIFVLLFPIFLCHHFLQLLDFFVYHPSNKEGDGETKVAEDIYQRKDKTAMAESSELPTTTPNNVLIAQYSSCMDNDSYSTLLNATSPVNQAYARHWGHDYMLLKGAPNFDKTNTNMSYSLIRLVANGTQVHDEFGPSCVSYHPTTGRNTSKPSSSRSTYNKVALLSLVMGHPLFRNHFDRLLILDADAMMVRLLSSAY